MHIHLHIIILLRAALHQLHHPRPLALLTLHHRTYVGQLPLLGLTLPLSIPQGIQPVPQLVAEQGVKEGQRGDNSRLLRGHLLDKPLP